MKRESMQISLMTGEVFNVQIIDKQDNIYIVTSPQKKGSRRKLFPNETIRSIIDEEDGTHKLITLSYLKNEEREDVGEVVYLLLRVMEERSSIRSSFRIKTNIVSTAFIVMREKLPNVSQMIGAPQQTRPAAPPVKESNFAIAQRLAAQRREETETPLDNYYAQKYGISGPDGLRTPGTDLMPQRMANMLAGYSTKIRAIEVKILDLSASGCQLKVKCFEWPEVAVNKTLKLDIPYEDGQMIRVVCKVLRVIVDCDIYKLGCTFVFNDESIKTEQALQKLVFKLEVK